MSPSCQLVGSHFPYLVPSLRSQTTLLHISIMTRRGGGDAIVAGCYSHTSASVFGEPMNKMLDPKRIIGRIDGWLSG